ncbi:hypothetical protein BT96DRAFT_979599 [Gymnopus androsaceus JB14]|uniref:Protein kinase domain-containing protein n=1 Tax=Gymnopus androsaceus JB14 TaxID=1447944 RepID=A0A6A4H2X8_9AGAR|nr:hypothetical protein BT96DRAFT_979599 [Gymnopus androsaceus JB14]
MISTEELQNNLLSWTKVEPLEPAAPHTTSLSTRKPSLYDLHMPSVLQPNKISLGKPERTLLLLGDQAPQFVNSAEDRYFQRLLAQEASVKALQGKHAHLLENSWTKIFQCIRTDVYVHNEEGVVEAQRQALDVVLRVAALALFELTDKQIEHLDTWKLLAATTSIEQDAKSDITIRIAKKDKIELGDDLRKGKCEPIWPLVQDLESIAYMDRLSSVECKNLLLGHPSAYLTLLSLIRLMECGKVTDFWEKTDCRNCSQFTNSHDAHRNHFEWDLPLDSSESFGLAASSNLDDYDKEIIRVLLIISSLPNTMQDVGPEVVDDATVRHKYRDPWTCMVEPHMRELWNVELRSLISKAGLQVPNLDEIMKWVPRVRCILIQCWAQMVRQNLTFGSVTSFNTSFSVKRVRGSQVASSPQIRTPSRAIISSFDHAEAEGYIIRQASWIVDAWEDAKNRSEEESGILAPWTDIFAPNAAPKVDHDDDGRALSHDPDDGDHDSDGTFSPPGEGSHVGDKPRLRSQTRKKKKPIKTAGPKSDAHDGSQRRGGGSGGGAAGGADGAGTSGGTDSSCGATGSEGTAQKHGRESTSDSTGNTDKRARQNQDNIQIRLESLHLAFNCPGTHLGSSGFSHFTRMLPSAISEPTENPLDLPARFSRNRTPSPSSRRPSTASISSTSTPSSSSCTSDNCSILSTPPTDFSTNSSFTPFSSQSSPLSKNVQTTSASSQILGLTSSALVNSRSKEERSSNTVTEAGVILEEKIGGSGSTEMIVWRGKLYIEGPLGEGHEPLPVVVKLADWETNSEADKGTATAHGHRLCQEAEIYKHIYLEGNNLTPPFYGIFENKGAIALILRFGGADFREPKNFDSLKKAKKQILFDRMVSLHAIGVEHNDIAGRNFLEGTKDSGGPLIINFENSKVGHSCPGPDMCNELRSFQKLLKHEKN